MEKQKVYCRKCFHYFLDKMRIRNLGWYQGYAPGHQFDFCDAPCNVITVHGYQGPEKKRIKTPQELNENNDCMMFKKNWLWWLV